VDWTIYGALIAGFLALAYASAHLVVRSLQTFRSFKQFVRHLALSLERLADASERASAAAERAGDLTALDVALRRLGVSLAELAVLREALDEANETFGRLAVVIPRT
jgi:hypothetical protein